MSLTPALYACCFFFFCFIHVYLVSYFLFKIENHKKQFFISWLCLRSHTPLHPWLQSPQNNKHLPPPPAQNLTPFFSIVMQGSDARHIRLFCYLKGQPRWGECGFILFIHTSTYAHKHAHSHSLHISTVLATLCSELEGIRNSQLKRLKT